jgi:hypothetical protein
MIVADVGAGGGAGAGGVGARLSLLQLVDGAPLGLLSRALRFGDAHRFLRDLFGREEAIAATAIGAGGDAWTRLRSLARVADSVCESESEGEDEGGAGDGFAEAAGAVEGADANVDAGAGAAADADAEAEGPFSSLQHLRPLENVGDRLLRPLLAEARAADALLHVSRAGDAI